MLSFHTYFALLLWILIHIDIQVVEISDVKQSRFKNLILAALKRYGLLRWKKMKKWKSRRINFHKELSIIYTTIYRLGYWYRQLHQKRLFLVIGIAFWIGKDTLKHLKSTINVKNHWHLGPIATFLKWFLTFLFLLTEFGIDAFQKNFKG